MPMNNRIMVPRASGFNPRSIANLTAWYDASNTGSITIATGVSQWNDLSGNGNHLVQGTGNNQPLYNAAQINGRPVLSFDGSNDTLRVAFTLSQPYTIFCVGRYTGANPSSNYTMFDGFTGGNRGRHAWGSTTATAGLLANAGTSLFGAGTYNMTQAAVHEVVFDGANSILSWNGTATNTGNTGTTAPGGLTLGAFGNGSSSFMEGQIAYVLVYSRALLAAERTRIRRDLGTIYGLTVA
jgi:hypothetical protein